MLQDALSIVYALDPIQRLDVCREALFRHYQDWRVKLRPLYVASHTDPEGALIGTLASLGNPVLATFWRDLCRMKDFQTGLRDYSRFGIRGLARLCVLHPSDQDARKALIQSLREWCDALRRNDILSGNEQFDEELASAKHIVSWSVSRWSNLLKTVCTGAEMEFFDALQRTAAFSGLTIAVNFKDDDELIIQPAEPERHHVSFLPKLKRGHEATQLAQASSAHGKPSRFTLEKEKEQ
jgi:hypothetical protein